MFKYSPREGTKAFEMNDNITEVVKAKRLNDIIDLQHQISFEINQSQIDTEEIILVEGNSKKSDDFLAGRTDTNKIVVFPRDEKINTGDYVKVKINRATSGTLFGEVINRNK